jgi:hypothetical protein
VAGSTVRSGSHVESLVEAVVVVDWSLKTGSRESKTEPIKAWTVKEWRKFVMANAHSACEFPIDCSVWRRQAAEVG